MTTSKKHSKPSGGRKRQARQASPEPPSLLDLLLTTIVGALLVGRLLIPTEASADGQTLWVTQLWLAAGIVWAWNCYREGAHRFRFDWGDAAVAALVAGHVISALYVVASGGDKRAAINMLWEWVGLGMTFFLVKQQLTSQREVRRLLLVTLAAVTVLAGLGIWQHFVSIPQTVREYNETVAEIERLQNAPAASSPREAIERKTRIRQLQYGLFVSGIPLEGPARKMSEFRLRSSREPFGPFALTNTFAGLLVATVIFALALLMRTWRRLGAGRTLIAPALAAALIAYCLFLTKSRTAMVGLFAGLAVWGGLTVRGRVGPRWSKWLAGGAAAIVLLCGALAVSGFGRAVVRQAGDQAAKSLLYRLEYWTAAWDVAWERPFFGVGPGNFRQHYLAHKLPQSSEEILDPHNLILDVWTSGGMIALAGLAGLVWFTAATIRSAQPADDESERRASERRASERRASERRASERRASERRASGRGESERGESERRASERGESRNEADDDLKLWHPLCVGSGAGFLLMMLAGYVSGASTGLRELVLLVGWIAAILVLRKTVSRVAVSAAAFVAAAAALTVHLLGAGGIEMPAITQTLLLLVLMASVPVRGAQSAGRGEYPHVTLESPAIAIASGSAIVAMFVLCLTTATLPVLNRRALVAAGNVAWLIDNNADAAARHYRDASVADPFSPEPVQKLSELLFLRWDRAPFGTEGDFERGVEFAKLAIERDPDGPHGYRRLGNWYLKRFDRTGDRKDATEAIELLGNAVDRYPHNSALRSEFTHAVAKSGNRQLASEEAEFALWLDEINRKALHPDKFLPWETVVSLRRIMRQQAPKKQSAPTSGGTGKAAK